MGISGRDYMRERRTAGFLPRGRSPTTWLLVTLTVLWFLYAASIGPSVGGGGLGRLITEILLLHPEDVLGRGRLWQPLTATWFHDPRTPWPLLVNLLALYSFGRMAEERHGGSGAAALYLLAGLLGMIVVVVLAAVGAFGPGPVLAYGAAPAILGLAAFVVAEGPRRPVLLLAFRLPLWAAALAYLLALEIPGLLAGRFAPASAAHLAGAAVGWGLARWPGRDPATRRTQNLGGARPAPPASDPGEAPDVRTRVDALLDRIARDGIGSLSDADKDFLERASRKYPRA